MTIEIQGIAYSPVEPELPDEDLWLESNRTVDVDNEVLEIFVGYLIHIIEKRDTNKVKVGHFRDENPETQERLNEIIGFDLDFGDTGSTEIREFEDYALSFAQRLKNEMDNRSSPGVLFTLRATRDDTPFVGLLKLDLSREERSILNPQTRSLSYTELEGVLPEPDRLQKGCTYPIFETEHFNLTNGDIKFLQEDSPSSYFEEFLDCVTSSASLRQSKNVLRTLDQLKRDKTGDGLTPTDIGRFDSSVRSSDTGIAGRDEVHSAASQILGQDYEDDEVDEYLYESGETDIQMDTDNTPGSVIYKVDGEIRIKAPMSFMDDERIEIQRPEHDGGNWIITIRGTTFERDFSK